MYISVLCSILIKVNMDRNEKTRLPGFCELFRKGELHYFSGWPDHIDSSNNKLTRLQLIKTETVRTTPRRLSNCTKAIEMQHQYIKRI